MEDKTVSPAAMAEAIEFQMHEDEAPLLFKTYALYLDAKFAFRFDICLNIKITGTGVVLHRQRDRRGRRADRVHPQA